MKTTLAKVVDGARIISRLNRVTMRSTTTARKIFSLKKLLEPGFEFYAEEEKKLIDKLGGAISEDGTILFADEDGYKKLAEGRKELFDTEWDVPIDKPIIFHDSEVVPVSGEDIEKLEGLADFKEG